MHTIRLTPDQAAVAVRKAAVDNRIQSYIERPGGEFVARPRDVDDVIDEFGRAIALAYTLGPFGFDLAMLAFTHVTRFDVPFPENWHQHVREVARASRATVEAVPACTARLVTSPSSLRCEKPCGHQSQPGDVRYIHLLHWARSPDGVGIAWAATEGNLAFDTTLMKILQRADGPGFFTTAKENGLPEGLTDKHLDDALHAGLITVGGLLPSRGRRVTLTENGSSVVNMLRAAWRSGIA
ncbi:hypothetical protein GCM10009733_021100 [Nonomuraea maheshkhaliensis]|uniref:HemN C-terminal domain-containing protein n=1 Tax=Nonomuraea maheshkhaliensis TaxID=419590 RepID=A0ABN2EZZ9_9ACTN